MKSSNLRRNTALLLIFFIIYSLSNIIKKYAYFFSNTISNYKSIPMISFDHSGLLGVYYFFIAVGIFLLIQKNYVPKLKKPSLLGVLLFILLFYSYMFVAHLMPLQFSQEHAVGVLILSELIFFSMVYLLIVWIFSDLFQKNKNLFITIYLVSLATINFTTLAWYDSLLVKLTVIASSFILNLFVGATYSFADSSSALFTSRSFSAGIGTQCSGIESSVLFVSLFFLIYIIERKRIISNKKFFSWGLVGFGFAFILNILRVTALMFIGHYNPEFAINAFHTYSATILFLGFMLPYMYLLYKYNMKKH